MAGGVTFHATAPAAQRAPRPSLRRVRVSCSAPVPAPDRRALLAGIAGVVAAPLLLAAAPAEAKMVEKVFKAENLTSFQRADLVEAFKQRAIRELLKVLTAADAPAALRLLLHDAGTYDAVTGTGGCNGSIVLSEELGHPENAGLKEIVSKLAVAKQAGGAIP